MQNKQRSYVSFDWAMKKLLRNKANFVILEGFLSTLLGFQLRVVQILESESTPQDEQEKGNKLDLLCEDDHHHLICIEVQYHREMDYFQRILFATSKLVTDYMNKGEKYSEVRKVYSINILYFDLGQGTDYVYHGRTTFTGLHQGDRLGLSRSQRNYFGKTDVSELYPEYYILKVNKFDDHAKTSLDEWIYFLKHSEIPQDYKAKGLQEAQEKLNYERMSKAEKQQYNNYMNSFVVTQSQLDTARYEGREEGREKGREEGIEHGREKGREELILQLYSQLQDVSRIAELLQMDEGFIRSLVSNGGDKE